MVVVKTGFNFSEKFPVKFCHFIVYTLYRNLSEKQENRKQIELKFLAKTTSKPLHSCTTNRLNFSFVKTKSKVHAKTVLTPSVAPSTDLHFGDPLTRKPIFIHYHKWMFSIRRSANDETMTKIYNNILSENLLNDE